MSQRTLSRRRQIRYDVSRAGNASVQFSHPRSGAEPLTLALVDIGVSGIRFAYGDELESLEIGATLGDVVIRIGECTMRGELVVMHLTEVSDSIVHCGALFYPASDEELVKLKGVTAGLSAARSD